MAAQASFLPISEISAYQSKWTIKARITNKANLRTFKRGAGEGKVFHVDLLDAAGGEIRATFFNDAADKFYDMLQLKKCFKFSKGSAKVANRQFNTTNHPYELTFEKDAIVEEVADDAGIAELSAFKFVDVAAVAQKQAPCKVDLCGIVSAFKPPSTVTTKDGRELAKRDITLVDDTANSIEVTLWNEFAKFEDNKFENQPVIGIKAAFIKEWNNGRTGSTLQGSGVVFNPDGAVAERIRKWWAQGGSSQALASISSSGGGGGRGRNAQHCNLATLRKYTSNLGEQVEFYNCAARLAILQTRKQGEQVPLYYKACGEIPEGKSITCNKRVDESGFCPSCGKNSGKTNLRINVRCRFSDFSDSAWLTTFHEAAEQILGMKAEQIQDTESGDGGRDKLEEQLKMRYFVEPMQVTVKANLGSWNGEPRPNVSCIEARPLNRREHGRVLLKEIQEMISA